MIFGTNHESVADAVSILGLVMVISIQKALKVYHNIISLFMFNFTNQKSIWIFSIAIAYKIDIVFGYIQ